MEMNVALQEVNGIGVRVVQTLHQNLKFVLNAINCRSKLYTIATYYTIRTLFNINITTIF